MSAVTDGFLDTTLRSAEVRSEINACTNPAASLPCVVSMLGLSATLVTVGVQNQNNGPGMIAAILGGGLAIADVVAGFYLYKQDAVNLVSTVARYVANSFYRR